MTQWVSLQVSQGHSQDVEWLGSHHEVWEESASNLIQFIDQIHFFTVVGLRTLFLGWFSAKRYTKLLEAACIP